MSDREVGERVILLGASGISLGLGPLLAALEHRLPSPLEIIGAFGYGRSYGVESRFLGRTVPGILPCGIWRRLREPIRDRPVRALLTDAGNDLVYGYDAATIQDWIRRCGERLLGRQVRLTITGLPISALRRLTPLRFEACRRLLFPRHRVDRHRLVAEAEELDHRLRDLATEWDAAWIDPDPDWYGIDPIHVRLTRRGEVWARVLDSWGEESSDPPPPLPLSERLTLIGVRPERWWRFGDPLGRSQPCHRTGRGSTLALY